MTAKIFNRYNDENKFVQNSLLQNRFRIFQKIKIYWI